MEMFDTTSRSSTLLQRLYFLFLQTSQCCFSFKFINSLVMGKIETKKKKTRFNVLLCELPLIVRDCREKKEIAEPVLTINWQILTIVKNFSCSSKNQTKDFGNQKKSVSFNELVLSDHFRWLKSTWDSRVKFNHLAAVNAQRRAIWQFQSIFSIYWSTRQPINYSFASIWWIQWDR